MRRISIIGLNAPAPIRKIAPRASDGEMKLPSTKNENLRDHCHVLRETSAQNVGQGACPARMILKPRSASDYMRGVSPGCPDHGKRAENTRRGPDPCSGRCR